MDKPKDEENLSDFYLIQKLPNTKKGGFIKYKRVQIKYVWVRGKHCGNKMNVKYCCTYLLIHVYLFIYSYGTNSFV